MSAFFLAFSLNTYTYIDFIERICVRYICIACRADISVRLSAMRKQEGRDIKLLVLMSEWITSDCNRLYGPAIIEAVIDSVGYERRRIGHLWGVVEIELYYAHVCNMTDKSLHYRI